MNRRLEEVTPAYPALHELSPLGKLVHKTRGLGEKVKKHVMLILGCVKNRTNGVNSGVNQHGKIHGKGDLSIIVDNSGGQGKEKR